MSHAYDKLIREFNQNILTKSVDVMQPTTMRKSSKLEDTILLRSSKMWTFQKSKRECQEFLTNMKDLIGQTKSQPKPTNSYQDIQTRINKRLQEIKQRVYQIVEEAFEQHRRILIQNFINQDCLQQTEQQQKVQRQLLLVQQQINNSLAGLQGSDFKKVISQTVLKNYEFTIRNLQPKLQKSTNNTELPIFIDQTAMNCITLDLKRLFNLPGRFQVENIQQESGCWGFSSKKAVRN